MEVKNECGQVRRVGSVRETHLMDTPTCRDASAGSGSLTGLTIVHHHAGTEPVIILASSAFLPFGYKLIAVMSVTVTIPCVHGVTGALSESSPVLICRGEAGLELSNSLPAVVDMG